MNVPSGVRMAEYCTPPGSSALTSLQVTRFTKAFRSGPVISNSPMWDTWNTLAPVRTAWCSARIPEGYCTGISQPAKGTIFAPKFRCASYKAVRLSVGVTVMFSSRNVGGTRTGVSGTSCLLPRLPSASPLTAHACPCPAHVFLSHKNRHHSLLRVQPVLGLVPHL